MLFLTGSDNVVAHLYISFLSNIIKSQTKMNNCIGIEPGTRDDLLNILEFDRNIFYNCSCMNNNITILPTNIIHAVCTEHGTLAGANTVVGFKFDNTIAPKKMPMFFDDKLVPRKGLSFQEFSISTNTIKIYVAGNLQDELTTDKIYNLYY